MIRKSAETQRSDAPMGPNGATDCAERFDGLMRDWKASKQYISSVSQMAMLPSYQQIIGMGPAVLPLIFQELQRQADHWFWALASITGDDPVLPEHRGKISLMRDDWLAWARAKGYLT